MSEYRRLKNAFIRVCGEPVREPPNQICDDDRGPAFICWIARNVWLWPDDSDGKDVQIHAWQGEAWVSEGDRVPGVWCGLNIEFKDAWRAVLPLVSAESVASIARTLGEYRVSFGSKNNLTERFSAIDGRELVPGQLAPDVNYQDIFLAIPGFDGDRIFRPQLQIYRKIGDWQSASNTVERLTRQITAVRSELTRLFHLVTGGAYPL